MDEPLPKKRHRKRQRIGPRKPLALRNAKGQQAAFVPTDEQRRKVENLVAGDFSTLEIAGALRISTATLERHFREELVDGRNRVHTDIANGIFQGAREGDRTLQIYASKARLGWRERAFNATGTVGTGTVATTFSISISE